LKYNYIIIEDNPKAVESLQLFMRDYSNFSNQGNASNLKNATQLILQKRPDLIFLDVELEDGNGFELIHKLQTKMDHLPIIIVTTSHDHYAKDAINNEAFYFISKPFDPEEIDTALLKFERKFSSQQKLIQIKNAEGQFYIQFEDIMLFMSDGNYTHVFKNNNECITATLSISELSERLPQEFKRIHKSFIINQKFVEFVNTSSKSIVLVSTVPITIVRNKVYEKDLNLGSNIALNSAFKHEQKVVIPFSKQYFEKIRIEN